MIGLGITMSSLQLYDWFRDYHVVFAMQGLSLGFRGPERHDRGQLGGPPRVRCKIGLGIRMSSFATCSLGLGVRMSSIILCFIVYFASLKHAEAQYAKQPYIYIYIYSLQRPRP